MKAGLKIIIPVLLILLPNCIKEQSEKPYIEIGEASWYGLEFQGSKTASGEIYDVNKLTAAHKKLAFGTFVRVTNINNQKKVFVRINDRGPYIKNRIIDLSKKAAERIDMVATGIAEVKIEVVSPTELKKLLRQDNLK